jgi:phasin
VSYWRQSLLAGEVRTVCLPFAPTWCSSRRTCASKFRDFLKDTYTTAAKGATDYNLKVIEIARTNTNAAFDYAYKLMGVKSPSELVDLSTAHARKQFEAITAQTKELTDLAQKVTTEITEPLKTGITKAFTNKIAGS